MWNHLWCPNDLRGSGIDGDDDENAGLVIGNLRVRVPGGAAGEFFSLELTFSADSYSVPFPSRVTAVVRKRPQSYCQKCRLQVTLKHAYNPTKSEWAVLSRYNVGTYQGTSSHATRQGTTSYSRLSFILA